MYGLPNGEVPSVGKPEMAWVSTPLPPVNLPAGGSGGGSFGGKREDDAEMGEGDAMAMDSREVHGGLDGEEQQHIDYDVADDNDWGVQ
ncbi:hypothetical protein B0J14DRAFT_604393 [Halenospora varia]|nr:hypothetical protein B0J14DRAFT_604393 [Halenospora varia]